MNAAGKESLLALIEAQHELQSRFVDIQRIDKHGGGGFFSLIFTATDKTTGKRVVLKVFNPFTNEPYRSESFKREAEILGKLNGREGIIGLISPYAQFIVELP